MVGGWKEVMLSNLTGGLGGWGLGLARLMGITVYFEHVLECFFFRKVNFKVQLVLEFENNTILKMIEKD